MRVLDTRLLKLALCFSLLACFALASPLAAYDCGCNGDCEYECDCGEECDCEEEEDCELCDECDEEEYEEECEEEGEIWDPYACCNPCECFIDGFSVGIDYLFWKPCVTGLHYAFRGDSAVLPVEEVLADTNELEYHYVRPSAESGFRVNMSSYFTTEGLKFNATYTDLGFESTNCIFSVNEGAISFSQAYPVDYGEVNGNEVSIATFDRAKGIWEMKYQTVETVLAYDLDLDAFIVTPYAGFEAMLLDQKFEIKGTDSLSEAPAEFKLRKHQQYFGVGPQLGFGAFYNYNDCISAFFDINVGLLLGSADERDRIEIEELVENEEEEEDEYTVAYKYKSTECYCFPGWHLKLGLAYSTCVCNLDVNFHIGYEFLEYSNAPDFFDFEQGAYGIISSTNSHNLTLRGLFTGVNVRF